VTLVQQRQFNQRHNVVSRRRAEVVTHASKGRRMTELKRGRTNYERREEGSRARRKVKEQEEKRKRCETKSNLLSFPPSSVHLRTTFRPMS